MSTKATHATRLRAGRQPFDRGERSGKTGGSPRRVQMQVGPFDAVLLGEWPGPPYGVSGHAAGAAIEKKFPMFTQAGCGIPRTPKDTCKAPYLSAEPGAQLRHPANTLLISRFCSC